MHHTRQILLAAVVVVSGLLGGCGAQPRTPEQEAAIHRVAIVSMLEEDVPIVRIGLTVFNNAATQVVPDRSINESATSTVAERLKRTRPQWVIVDAKYDARALVNKLRSPKGFIHGYDADKVSADLTEIARVAGADALLVVVPEGYERVPVVGVGVAMRTLSMSSVGNADIYSAITIRMLDRTGKQIDAAGTMHETQVSLPAASLGLSYDLTAVNTPEAKAKISTALLNQLRRGVDACMTGLKL